MPVRPLFSAVIPVLVVAALAACTPPAALSGPPAGWADLTHCDGAPDEPWIWIDGFPAAEMTSAGLTAECGDVWLADDGDHFLGVVDHSVSSAELDAFGSELERAGYELYVDDFPYESGEPGGARDYYVPDLSTYVAIEIYPADGELWTTYIDYHSPETRALR